MKKMAIYNGNNQSKCRCSAPYQLQVGKMYEVIDQEVGRWQTNYKLKGVDGEYDSRWFDEVQVHFGLSNEIPVVGKCCICRKVKFDLLGTVELIGWCTNTVQAVEVIANNTYKVIASDGIYIITVSD